MVAGEPDKGINDPVVEELAWHPLNSGAGGKHLPTQTYKERTSGGRGGLETVSAVLSRIIQRTRRFIRAEKCSD